jgi:tetratricopeptide (TPR) repeat protein
LIPLLVAAAACSSRPEPVKPPPPLVADAYAHYLRGRVAALEGDDETAAREFARAAAVAPDQPAIAIARIEALLGARRRSDAQAAAEHALTRWPGRAEILLAAGRAYRANRRHAHAIATLERARDLSRDARTSEDATLELAAAYIAVERPERAAAAYRALIEEHPDLVAPQRRLLSLLIKQRRFAQAEPIGRRLLEMRPDHVRARVLYARALRGLGKRDEALAALRGAFERSGGGISVGAQLFDALLEANERAAAIDVIDYVASGELSDADRVRVGQLYLRVGHSARAQALAEAVLATGADEDAIALQASALASRREFARAAAAIAALKDAPPWAVSFTAEMLAHAGDRDRALERVDALEPRPQREIARARVLELTGDVAGARTTLTAARREWPRDSEVVYALAALELRAGNHPRAARLGEILLRADPDDVELLNFLGYVLADGGLELERARRLLGRALRRSPGSAGILDSVGWMHFRRGSLGDAARHLYRALRLAPVEAEILFHVGSLERKLGRQRAALRRLRLARSHALEPSLQKQIDAEIARLRR